MRRFRSELEVSELPVKLDAVRLRVSTSRGIYGFDASFSGGVTVVRGSNTVGKSLLLQSLLYGLGMDDLYATQQGTLTRAMTSTLDTEDGRVDVLSSEVWLQATSTTDTITTQRFVKPPLDSAPNAHQLVAVWNDAILTRSGDTAEHPTHYFVNRRGAAEDRRGFHTFLADFLGLELPKVPNYSDSETRLYIQVLFGLCYVEQKRGWGGTVPQVPTKYRIVEPLRRSVEFVLELEALEKLTRRRTLDDTIRHLEAKENHLRGRLEAAASMNGARLLTLRLPNKAAKSPRSITDGYTPEAIPEFEVYSTDAWIPLDERISQLQQSRVARARKTAEAEDRSEKAVILDLERELADVQAAIKSASLQLREINDAETMLDSQMGALSRRLARIEEELSRYSQLRVLSSLGAAVAPSILVDGDCPTCHQSLLGVENPDDANVLPVDDTVAVLTNERGTVQGLIAQAEEATVRLEPRRVALAAALSDLRAQARALQNDLTAPDSLPSVADLQRALSQEALERGLTQLRENTGPDIEAWRRTVAAYVRSLLERIELGDVSLSIADRRKVERWNELLRQLLASFEFASARPEEVAIDEAMRPTVEGYDISFQNSASDGIRLRWAYLLSLLVLATSIGHRHPGLVLLDEPGQQGVESASLAALYQKAVEVAVHGQVFLTTSEPRNVLSSWFAARSFQLIDLGDKRLLQPIA